MHVSSALAAAAGAVLFSVTEAAVCRPKSPGNYGTSGQYTAPLPQGSGNQGGWNNWNGSPMVIRTTTMPYNNQMNPQATNGPKWGGWNGGANTVPAPVPTYAAQPPVYGSGYPGEPQTLTLTLSSAIPTTSATTGLISTGVTATGSNSLTGNPIPAMTTTTLVTVQTTTSVTGGVVSPSAITTTSTTTSTITSDITATTTTATPTSVNPACPTGTFVLRATNAENPALEGLYAGLAFNGQGNLVALSEPTTANAVQVAFDANCQLVSAVGPLLVLDDAGSFSAIHYQYMSDPATLPANLAAQTDVCSIDVNNVLSCSVGGQTVLQTVDDVLSIGDQLYYQSVTIVLEPVV